MSAARDVIARALEFEFGSIAVEVADMVLSDLSTAGYRIVGPGALDRETLSVAALTAWLHAKQGDMAGQISEAIEALGGKDE